MLTKTIIAASALLSMAAAVPLQQQDKRDVKWQTSTMWDVTTIDVTTTIWLAPGETPPAGGAGGAPHDRAHGHHHHHKVTSHIKSTVTVQPASSAPAAQSSPYVSPVSPAPSPPIASAKPLTTTPAAETTTAAASPPAETTTWANTASYVPPLVSTPSPTATGGSTGTSPNGAVYTGDITHYAPGLGSCGETSSADEAIVALPFGMMNNGANPNTNPLCGKMITISYAGSQHTAKIVDTCMGCYGAAIDLSPSLFVAVAPQGNGRVSGVEWWFD